ncbi:hypothetical protein F5146DRAFT_1001573 [Armillaria mellea]|nr:hypothetical protein F5146DRAFT_1001573 [Armillaria mellea]
MISPRGDSFEDAVPCCSLTIRLVLWDQYFPRYLRLDHPHQIQWFKRHFSRRSISNPNCPRNQEKYLHLLKIRYTVNAQRIRTNDCNWRIEQLLRGIGTKPYKCPTKSISTDPIHKTPIIIGAVIGSLVSLMLILGGGTLLFIRKQRGITMKRCLSPNLKMIPELDAHSPPGGNKNSVLIPPMLVGGVAPASGDRRQDVIEQNEEGNPGVDEGEGRDIMSSLIHPDTSEPRGAPQEASPQPALDVVAEVVRLRTQFQQFIEERDAERVHGNVLDLSNCLPVNFIHSLQIAK